MISELINIPASKFHSFNHTRLKAGNFVSDSINVMYRNMHTIKGMSRSYDLTSLADAAHRAENSYRDIKENGNIDIEKLEVELCELLETIDIYENLNDEKLGRTRVHLNNVITIK